MQDILDCTLVALFHCMVQHGTVRYGSLLGGFPLGTVPGTFLVPPQPSFPAIRTVTKTVRITDWLERIVITASLNVWHDTQPLDLNQHSQRRIGRSFLYQPQNSSVVVCWGSTDVPLVYNRGADPARDWWRNAEGKSLMYILLNLLYFQNMSSVYIFTFCMCVLLQLKTIWSNKCTSKLY